MLLTVASACVQGNAELWVPHEDSEENDEEQLDADDKQSETDRLKLEHLTDAASTAIVYPSGC